MMRTNPRPLGGYRSADREGREQRQRLGEDDTTTRTAVAVDVYASLHAEWAAIANRPAAVRACRAWGHRCPQLVPFASPHDLVAAIGCLGDPIRSCALLSELLFLAADDTLAARAVLQTVLPGLRRAARERWRRAQPGGPWRNEQDVAHDALSAGWEAITSWAGHRHPRPAALIVRGVEGRLRRIYQAWHREAFRTTAITDSVPEPWLFGNLVRNPESEATALIAEAQAARVLDHRDAALLFACGVTGVPVSRAEQTIGLGPGVGHRLLAQSQKALRAWLTGDDVHQFTPSRPVQPVHDTSCRPLADRTPARFADDNTPEDPSMTPLLLTPTQAAALLGISRSKLYALLGAGEIESVTIGASRRIPYQDLTRYVERLRNQDVPASREPFAVVHGGLNSAKSLNQAGTRQEDAG
jgi:excisionase family DNA binding protein